MATEISAWRRWVLPMATLASLALAVFAVLYTVDVAGRPDSVGLTPVERYFRFNADHITDAVSALGAMIAAVLAIVITVVSIVVQLSADRFPGVARMFLRDRRNIVVMAYYVVTCTYGVLVSVTLQDDFAPTVTLAAMIGLTTGGLVLMAPYFAYVFWFLEPTNIIARIRMDAIAAVQGGSRTTNRAVCEESQARVISAMEELTDVTSNSIGGKDKIIASRAVDALKDFAVSYIGEMKDRASDPWFDLGATIRENPDFVAMEQESRRDLVERRTWVEWKVMRQYLGIYNEALSMVSAMPDINYLIAIDTRYIGEAAAKARDEELVTLVFRFMNSYLRATLNAKNVRTAYNVFNQYRQLVEAMMRHDLGGHAAAAVEHMKYYGHVSYDMNLPFVTETVAYDMGALCEVAHSLHLPEEEEILETFLELDRATARRSEERALQGVRKAQVKLAAYYLTVDEREKARHIYRDMEHDPPERLEAIRKELERVETKDFWEIIDRGRNFEYMPDAQKEAMRRFFTWFSGAESSSEPGRPSAPPPTRSPGSLSPKSAPEAHSASPDAQFEPEPPSSKRGKSRESAAE